jgi:predicted transcriptional regulator
MTVKSKKRNMAAAPGGSGPLSISDAEWTVMELLWESSPRTSADLCAMLQKTRHWKRATVMTLISRLIAKDAIVTEGEGRRWQYAPAIPRECCVAQETRGFLNRLFKGALLPMVAHCIEHQKLGANELSELRSLLNHAKPKSRPSSSHS